MKPLTAVVPYSSDPLFKKTLLALIKSEMVDPILIISQDPVNLEMDRCRVLVAGPLSSEATLSLILDGIRTKYLLLLPGAQPISIQPEALEKIFEKAESTKAGLVYSDFYEEREHKKVLYPLNDYQPGSVRDDFEFGAMILLSVRAVRKAVKRYGLISGVNFASLYDLRLKLSIDHPFYHFQEPLYRVTGGNEPSRKSREGEKIFTYVDPRNLALQKEMEAVFTDYLKKIGAYLPGSHLKRYTEVEKTSKSFPVEASVIIPVRNREETISEAVESGLSQKTDFPFNVVVVDNHSTDGTTTVLSNLAKRHSNLKHMVPIRTDLGIGGCWNEALHAEACGRYAVQLDSDDLYSSGHTLQKMVDMLRQGSYAMVIGSYTLVDSNREEIPPGLIDHREWTDENGHNNALRINGLGAPRAFNTRLMRKIGFPNVSYGEDYSAALRICREYRIGRIYESLYLCRRWSDNTDSSLDLGEANRNNAFKDKIRTDEILARQEANRALSTDHSRQGKFNVAKKSE